MRDDERAAYLTRLRERAAAVRAGGVHFWTFEHERHRGRFVEFVEARDGAALAVAIAHDPLFTDVYVEVDVTAPAP